MAVSTASPLNPNTRLRRRQLAEELTKAGFPVAEGTLQTKASRGGGPPYSVFGRTVLYRWGDALAWAEGRLTPPRRSTSEVDNQRSPKMREDRAIEQSWPDANPRYVWPPPLGPPIPK
jgi:hypothetical protein